MRLSPTPGLMGGDDNDAVLNLAQIEDLMDDDSHNPVTSGELNKLDIPANKTPVHYKLLYCVSLRVAILSFCGVNLCYLKV